MENSQNIRALEWLLELSMIVGKTQMMNPLKNWTKLFSKEKVNLQLMTGLYACNLMEFLLIKFLKLFKLLFLKICITKLHYVKKERQKLQKQFFIKQIICQKLKWFFTIIMIWCLLKRKSLMFSTMYFKKIFQIY